jgi:hypothetical protein
MFPIKKLSIVLLGLCLCAPTPRATNAQTSNEKPQETGRVLKWLGVAGWEIQIDQTVILIDPFLTRGEANPGAEWKTDEAAVLKAINRADYIFAGHSHADHIADIPFIAKKFGSKVIGSRTTTNIALTAGVDKSQLVTISGGEKLDFKDFSVQVIESEHGGVRQSVDAYGDQDLRKSRNPGPGLSGVAILSREVVISTTSPWVSIGCCIKARPVSSKASLRLSARMFCCWQQLRGSTIYAAF